MEIMVFGGVVRLYFGWVCWLSELVVRSFTGGLRCFLQAKNNRGVRFFQALWWLFEGYLP